MKRSGLHHTQLLLVASFAMTLATAERVFAPRDAAEKLIRLMQSLTLRSSGSFFDWAGKPIPR